MSDDGSHLNPDGTLTDERLRRLYQAAFRASARTKAEGREFMEDVMRALEELQHRRAKETPPT
jgi:hypothetical protein